MAIQKGDMIPNIAVTIATEEGPKPAQSADIFAGQKTALFAVPGAYTPTCSARHLPGFVEQAEKLKAKGIDQIVCLSVNDAFVMRAWGESQQATEKVTFLADGNGELTKALGLEMDASGFGMGTRSQRYSLIVEDGIVETINIEAPGDFEVSSADYMLGQL